MNSILSPWGKESICATSGILANGQACKFHAQIWQFWKSTIILETAAHRAKICSISTSWDRKRVYVQLLELWPMAKLVVKQTAKAHGPLVSRIAWVRGVGTICWSLVYIQTVNLGSDVGSWLRERGTSNQKKGSYMEGKGSYMERIPCFINVWSNGTTLCSIWTPKTCTVESALRLPRKLTPPQNQDYIFSNPKLYTKAVLFQK